MKKGIHPNFFMTKFTDISSGTQFMIGSTLEEFQVEISSASHPVYTGESIIVDTENKVEEFNKKIEKQKKMGDKVGKKKQKLENRRKTRVQKVEAKQTLTLRDMLKNSGN